MARAAELANRFISLAAGGGRGQPSRAQVQDALLETVADGYHPTTPLAMLAGATCDITGLIANFYFDLETMLLHRSVAVPLNVVKAPIAVAEFDVQASDPRCERFARAQLQHYWDTGLRHFTDGGYSHGWAGAEALYGKVEGVLGLVGLAEAAPRDVAPLVVRGRQVGVRMRNVSAGECDLWTGSETVPAKGLWYAHRRRNGLHYGSSQLLPAWRDWSRLAKRNGAEELDELGCYRFALGNWLIRYPNEKVRTATDGEVNARDVARQLGETLKTGGSVEMSSTRYGPEMNHEYKWQIEHISPNVRLSELGEREDRLVKAVREAIGVPPEILEASEVGSGFSGRMIPLVVFLLDRQKEADALCEQFVKQVLLPLVRWNYGPKAWVRVKVRPMLETFRRLFAPPGAGGPTGGALPGGMPGGGGGGPTPGAGMATPGVGRSGQATGHPSPEQVMAAVLQAQMEATRRGDPHANDEEIQHLLDLLPGRQKQEVTDGYVGGVSRRHHLKAVGVGSHAGEILYGNQAQRAVSRNGTAPVKTGD